MVHDPICPHLAYSSGCPVVDLSIHSEGGILVFCDNIDSWTIETKIVEAWLERNITDNQQYLRIGQYSKSD